VSSLPLDFGYEDRCASRPAASGVALDAVAPGVGSVPHEGAAALDRDDEALLLEKVDGFSDCGQRAGVLLGEFVERGQLLSGLVLAGVDLAAQIVRYTDLERASVGKAGRHSSTS
jgi:hypothetical protein